MDFNALAMECAPMVSPKTLAAIVKTESNFNPLAINVNKGYRLERQPKSKSEAIATAKWLINNHYNIDMGLGQVNSANLIKTKLSVEDAFDPCKNLAAAASILQWNYESASKKITGEQQALHAAISAYNTGSFNRGFSNGYVQKVVNNTYRKNIKLPTNAKEKDFNPIKLVNSLKEEIPKNTVAISPEIALLRDKHTLQQNRPKLDNELAVYQSDDLAQSIMVYR